MNESRTGGSTGTNEAIAFTAALLVLTLTLLFSTSGLQPSAAIVPRMVGGPLVLLLCYRLVRELGDRQRIREAGTDPRPDDRPDALSAVLWLLALPAVSTILGFVAGPAIYVFAWTRFHGRERTGVAIAAGALTAVVILILFVGLLKARLPQGLLGVMV